MGYVMEVMTINNELALSLGLAPFQQRDPAVGVRIALSFMSSAAHARH
jgi:hypothetical protein